MSKMMVLRLVRPFLSADTKAGVPCLRLQRLGDEGQGNYKHDKGNTQATINTVNKAKHQF